MGGKEEREAARRDLEKIRARERAAREQRIQDRLDAEAAQEDRDAKMDDAFMREARGMFGVELTEIEEFARENADDLIDAGEAQRVIQRARKQARGGWFTRPNKNKAARTLRGSKAVRDAAKQAKKKKDGCLGCAVVTVLTLAGSAGSVVWGAVELVAALTA